MRCVTSPALKGGRAGLDKTLMKSVFLALAVQAFASSAYAELRVYELSVPAVQCPYSSERAVQAVEGAVPISYVRADPKAHKVTVRFEDEETSLDAIATALGDRGYQVVRQKRLR